MPEALAGETCFKANFAGIGAFPDVQRPRVIKVGVKEGREKIVRIALKIESELEKYGFAREERPFSAHLTIGRVRSPKGIENLKKKMTDFVEFDAGTSEVLEICLMQSNLNKAGPVYSILKKFKLKEG